ncbi:hypothetical protein ABT061_43525 [Streptosporangium sp. NPDC002544]|uniref:hypothetical protein n=1 Tax=Streptosporangium sp. NPDC002544 TaxID=3154538 RepID=UPI00332C3B45
MAIQVLDRLPVGRRGTRVRAGRFEEDLHVRLRQRADARPPHPLEFDVIVYLKAEHVTVDEPRRVS